MVDPAAPRGEPGRRDDPDGRGRRGNDPGGRERGLGRLLLRFAALTLRQAHEDSILLTSSALAFVSILSLIPFLAAFSYVGARVFNQYQQRSLEIFVQVLPYSEESVVEKLAEFLDKAETIHGFGVVIFFVTTLFAFSTVEEALNRIWDVVRRRPWRARLLSFSMLLLWGPLVLGTTFSSLIVLRQAPALRRVLEESALLSLLPFAAAALGLTILYWVVPFTRVEPRSALAGGLAAAILLELLRQGFAYYVQLFRDVNVVYGSFAFVLLFMVSIDLTWLIVLLGCEVAYTAQNFTRLGRGQPHHGPLQASWVGLAALAHLSRAFGRGEPVVRREALAGRLHLSLRELDRVLHPLLAQGLLRESPAEEAYLLSIDPHHLPVDTVFAAYDHRARRAVEPVGGDLGESLAKLVSAVARGRLQAVGDLTVGDLATPHPAERGRPSADSTANLNP